MQKTGWARSAIKQHDLFHELTHKCLWTHPALLAALIAVVLASSVSALLWRAAPQSPVKFFSFDNSSVPTLAPDEKMIYNSGDNALWYIARSRNYRTEVLARFDPRQQSVRVVQPLSFGNGFAENFVSDTQGSFWIFAVSSSPVTLTYSQQLIHYRPLTRQAQTFALPQNAGGAGFAFDPKTRGQGSGWLVTPGATFYLTGWTLQPALSAPTVFLLCSVVVSFSLSH